MKRFSKSKPTTRENLNKIKVNETGKWAVYKILDSKNRCLFVGKCLVEKLKDEIFIHRGFKRS